MSARRRPPGGRRGGKERRDKTVEMWKAVPEPAPPEPIRRAADPSAVVRSLGPPPLTGQGAVAEHYLAAVAERAATTAVALAAAVDLLEPDADDD
jgi:hypothetical protein